MSHVDDGTLHAWLDGAFAPDDPEREAIEGHLAGCEACRSRLELERRIRDRAADVLGATSPDAVRVEPFETILAARRARDREAGAAAAAVAENRIEGDDDSLARRRQRRGFRLPMALAASLALAVTAGWFARQYLPARTAVLDTATTDQESVPAAPQFGRVQADAGATQSAPSGEREAAPPAVAPRPSPREAARQAVAAPPAADTGIDARATFPDRLSLDEIIVTSAAADTTRAARAAAAPPAAAADVSIRGTEETRRMAASMLRQEPVALAGGVGVQGAGVESAAAAEAGDRVMAAVPVTAWRTAGVDSVAPWIGSPALALPDLEADSVQIGTIDGSPVARLVYRIDGQRVELIQWPAGSLNGVADRDDVANRARRDVTEEAEAKAVAAVSPGAFRLAGTDFLLRGALAPDSLAALSKRVRGR